MLDLNTIDHIDNIVYPPPDFINVEEYLEKKQVIFNQLRDLENLGVNILKEFEEDNVKNMIYNDIIDFSRENYLDLVDKDYILNEYQLKETANIIYQFLCVDCFNVLIPRILEQSNIQSISQYDKLVFNNRFEDNYIKKIIINNLSEIVTNLLKLQKFDQTISDDESYKTLVKTFGNYLELIDFSDGEKINENYIRPLLNKFFPQLLWRTLSTVN
jgi:hypothetical protein